MLINGEGGLADKKIEPPKHFTEATLLQAMTGIARFVANKDLKAISVRPMALEQRQIKGHSRYFVQKTATNLDKVKAFIAALRGEV